MRILTNENFENLIDKELNNMSLNESLRRGITTNEYIRGGESGLISPKTKHLYLPSNESYGIITVKPKSGADKLKGVIVDLAGPIEEVPNAIVLTKENEYIAKKYINKEKSSISQDWPATHQLQLIILNEGIYYRELEIYGKNMHIMNYFAYALNRYANESCKIDQTTIDFYLNRSINHIEKGEQHLQCNPILKILYETDELKGMIKKTLEDKGLQKIIN